MTKELAISIICGDVLGTSEQTHEAVKMAVKALSSAQPKGHWIGNYAPYRCSECEKHSDSMTNFCWNCGADMREEK